MREAVRPAVEDFYQARLLLPKDAAAAYPLVSMLHPEVTLDFWRRFVRRATRQPSQREGLVAVRDRRDYVHAIFAYRVSEDIRYGLLLRVTYVIMGRLPGGVLPHAIVAHAAHLARELGDSTIAIEATSDVLSADDLTALHQAGFRAGGFVMVRSGAPAPA